MARASSRILVLIVSAFVFSFQTSAAPVATTTTAIASTAAIAPLPFPLGSASGFADYHVHQFANLGYDGRLLWGSAEGAENTALKSCTGTNHAVSWIPGLITGLAVSPELGMHNFGTSGHPNYKDWPLWSTVTHQQVWEGWLKKAHQDGLNLIVMSAVNFRYICGIMPKGNGFNDTSGGTKPCDDMKNVKRQLEAAKAFAARNSSWYEIALTPEHARRIIQQGKLAVILAIETSEIFNTVNTEADLETELTYYYNMGVRSIQPVHELNNKFGGTAYFQKMFDLVQAFVNVKSFFTGGSDGTVDELKAAFDGIKTDSSKNNLQGLTPLGKSLVQKLMDKKMIVDVAHLSTRSFTDAYDISVKNKYYPLLMSHTHFRQMFRGKLVDEKKIPTDGVKMIKKTGGVIGLRTGNEKQNTYGKASVANNCHGSSRSFAQSYLLGAIGYGVPIGFASDFNGFIDQMRPRYYDSNAKYGGSAEKWACGEDTNGEEREVSRKSQGSRSSGTGGEFDLIGYAHIGYTKDVMRDLNKLGVDTVVIGNSAESFLKMWDRAFDANRAAKSDTIDTSGVIVTSADDDKCPSLRAKLGTFNNKVVCKALPHFSIKDKNCDGSKWNGFCIWNEGDWYRAREIR